MATKHHVTANEYNKQANSYEAKWEAYLAHTHQKMADALELEPSSKVCDVSCGTGLFTYKLFQKQLNLELLQLNDISQEMLSYAKERFSKTDTITFTNFPAHEIDQSATPFDALISLNAFHNYDQQKKSIEACYNSLKPNGEIYILDWNRSGLFRIMNFWIRLFVKERIDTRTLSEMEKLLEDAKFSIKHTEEWSWRYWKFFLIVGEKSGDEA